MLYKPTLKNSKT